VLISDPAVGRCRTPGGKEAQGLAKVLSRAVRKPPTWCVRSGQGTLGRGVAYVLWAAVLPGGGGGERLRLLPVSCRQGHRAHFMG